MAIKNVQFTIRGDHELLMNSPAGMNPYLPLSMEMKKLTSKRTKTDEDKLKISDLEFQLALYWDAENKCVCIPGWNIERCIRDGAQIRKKGKDIQRYVRVVEQNPELHYGKRLTLQQIVADYSFRDVRNVKVMRAGILRTRPRFAPGWSVSFTVQFDDTNIDLEIIRQSIEDAGHYVGLCDFRPHYGTFVISE